MKHLWSATTAITLLLTSTSLFPPAFAKSSAAAQNAPGDDPKPSDTKPEKPVETLKPCQVRSPNTGSFFDLNPLRVVLPSEEEDDKSAYSRLGVETKRNTSWHARGYDYPANFTINFCGGVVEAEKTVQGVDKVLWQNMSAFYEMNDMRYSIGLQNDELTFRGRKLTLNYTGGSPCPEPGEKEDTAMGEANSAVAARQKPIRRKSTLIYLLCDRTPQAPKVSVAFVGTIDECSYFFEARTYSACPALNVEKQQVGPSGVFGLIFGIAILVYLVGGVVYQRAVLHQRGWHQLPNYTLWASIATFVNDVLLVVFSSCMQCCSSGRRKNTGYGHVNGANGYANGAFPSSFGSSTGDNDSRARDDETRLIDQLDEVWDD